MKKLFLLVLTAVMSLSIIACGGEPQAAAENVSLIDITTEQGLGMKLPSDITFNKDTLAYMNGETGDNVAFAVTDAADLLISEWTKEDALASYQSKYPDATVESFENVEINGRKALVCSVNLTSPGGSALTIVLVIVTDGTTNHVVNFTHGKDNADSSLASNLQTCIDSITIASK